MDIDSLTVDKVLNNQISSWRILCYSSPVFNSLPTGVKTLAVSDIDFFMIASLFIRSSLLFLVI